MVYAPSDGSPKTTLDVYSFKGKGVAMSMYNTDEVIRFSWQSGPFYSILMLYLFLVYNRVCSFTV
jgi:hypothetical protein